MNALSISSPFLHFRSNASLRSQAQPIQLAAGAMKCVKSTGQSLRVFEGKAWAALQVALMATSR